MAEPHPRRGLKDLFPEVVVHISKFADGPSRLAFASCSKHTRSLWARFAFARIRFEGDQESLANRLELYLNRRSTIPRHQIKSLTIVLWPPPTRPVATWDIDQPRDTPSYVLQGLPGLITEVLRRSVRLDVLRLKLHHLTPDQGMSLRQSLSHSRGLPKVKHLTVYACPAAAGTIIQRCAASESLISLQLNSGFPSTGLQFASIRQPSLRRLALVIDTNIDVAGLPTQHINRINPAMHSTLVQDITTLFTRLEWLVLAATHMDAPRPFNTEAEGAFLDHHIILLCNAINGAPTLKRIAFTLPAAQIGSRIIRDSPDEVPETPVDQFRRDCCFVGLVSRFFGRAPQLEQVCIMTGPGEAYSGIRTPGGMDFEKETLISVGSRPAHFPWGLFE
ncbi:hypothetical protein NW759_008296 [Fusarium solani]|nr:hypothetical protein NW759_008296 [Fusarium solani]